MKRIINIGFILIWCSICVAGTNLYFVETKIEFVIQILIIVIFVLLYILLKILENDID